ncbi:MAG: DUF4129 domain-containing protein [Streptosporangiaceae bacterium]
MRIRVATVAVLLALAAAGLRAHGTFSREVSAAGAATSGAVLAVALAVVEGVGLVAFIIVLAMARPVRPKKEDEDEPPRPPFPWWAKTVGVLLALAALLTPPVVLLEKEGHKQITPPVAVHPGVPAGRTGHLANPGATDPWPVIVGMLLAIAAVVALALATRVRRTPAQPRTRSAGALLDALAAGHDALISGGDPRRAIIACYAALERGFAAVGSAPAAADTPAEVLTRATEAGIVRSDSAGVLTGIFRRARYGTQPMTDADSTQAATALAQMRAELAGLKS